VLHGTKGFGHPCESSVWQNNTPTASCSIPSGVRPYSDREQFHAESFAEIYSQVEAWGLVFKKLGIQRGEHLGIISDNRKEWATGDLAILGLGAADVPRGSDSTQEEIAYILKHAGL
jgi:long-subunit acyl-CoA synthetase (AMP-forming)